MFSLIQVAPGDAVLAALGDAGGLTPEQLRLRREELGLERLQAVQYVDWWGRVSRGDLGSSFVNGRPIGREFTRRYFAFLNSFLSGC